MGGSVCNFEAMFSKNWFYQVIVKVHFKEIIKDQFLMVFYMKKIIKMRSKKENLSKFMKCLLKIMIKKISLLSGLRTSKQYTLYNHYKDISQHLKQMKITVLLETNYSGGGFHLLIQSTHVMI